MKFELLGTDGRARRGRMSFPHGDVETPAFMPVGTYGTVKAMTPAELTEIGAQIILGNTFHLWLRPGLDVIARTRRPASLHGLGAADPHRLGRLPGLQPGRRCARSREEGVSFRSPVNGDRLFLTPEGSMQIQRDAGRDIVMVFDECTPVPGDRRARRAIRCSCRCAGRSAAAPSSRACRIRNALFGIVQGGMYRGLREESLAGLRAIGFDGYAIGGLAVGEPKEERESMLDTIAPHLPADRPRYLMGVGTPEDLVEAVRRGIDMFDCVMPTRNARNG